jgi:hypothetical protein
MLRTETATAMGGEVMKVTHVGDVCPSVQILKHG